MDLMRFAGLSEEEMQVAIDALSKEECDKLRDWLAWNRWPEKARGDLLEFCQFTMPDPEHHQSARHSKYSVAPHHRLLAEALGQVMSGKCLRLIISMPPQHGKSETATRRFIAYHMGKFPWKHLLCAAYNQTFAEEFGEEVRAIITSDTFHKVFPRFALRGGSKAKDHMVTAENGKANFAGLRGSIAGRPADGVVIDDPIKNAKEAESKTFRDDVWDSYTRLINARAHVLTWIIIITTRWNEDDLVGRLTDPKNPHYNADVAAQWTVINLPAILDDEVIAKALGKKVGEALWPERFPLSLLETARKMDPYGFSALYMGKPTPPEGAFYKQHHLQTYDSFAQLPKRFRAYLTADLAVSPEKNADKSCAGVWFLDEDDCLWLHPELYWDRKSSDESVEKLIELGSRYKVSDCWMEKGQMDKAIGPFFEKRHMELVRQGKAKSPQGVQYKPQYFNIQRLPVAGSKGLRSVSIRGRMAQGKVKFPSFAPWWSSAKEQMLKFTGSGDDKEDDFCDMAALIGQALDDQVPVGREAANQQEYKFRPTLAWMKADHNERQRAAKARAGLRGM